MRKKQFSGWACGKTSLSRQSSPINCSAKGEKKRVRVPKVSQRLTLGFGIFVKKNGPYASADGGEKGFE